MPKLKGVIAENAMANFRRLITEAPEAQSMPKFFSNLLLKLVTLRGHFDPSLSPEHSLAFAGKTPILFVHSKADKVVSYQQTKDLNSAADVVSSRSRLMGFFITMALLGVRPSPLY
jgi:fermentation-respiration switch protein FrsA (DUF1100 family)